MPPITRQQSKKFSSKPEPYSRENCSIEKRSVLQDLVANNVSRFNYLYQNHMN